MLFQNRVLPRSLGANFNHGFSTLAEKGADDSIEKVKPFWSIDDECLLSTHRKVGIERGPHNFQELHMFLLS